MLISICRLLRERLPDVRLVVLSEKRVHIERYMAAEGIQLRALDKWRQLPRTLSSLARADAFVLGGGVPIYDKPSHTAVFAALIGIAKLAGCRTASFGIASQAVTKRAGAAVLRRLIESMDLVAVRDPRTLRQLRAIGIDRPIQLTADPAFLLEPATAERVDAILAAENIGDGGRRPLVAITTRKLSATHPYGADHYPQLGARDIDGFHEAMARTADWLAERATVVFVPHHRVAPDDDRVAARDIIPRMKRGAEARLLEHRYTPSETLGIYSRCDFMVCSRLHSAVLAAAASVPFVMVAYASKLFRITEALGVEENAIDIVGLTPERLLNLVGRAWAGR